MEEWKAIDNYPDYEVSNYGNVRSIDKIIIDKWNRKYFRVGKVLTAQIDIHGDGYRQAFVTIYKDRKRHRVLISRLVAKAFIPNPLNLPMVNHKDENSINNIVDNLEWCDAKYNNNYGTAIKRRSEKKRKRIDIFDSNHNYLETLESGIDVSKKYKVSRGHISMACHHHKKALDYYFEFSTDN